LQQLRVHGRGGFGAFAGRDNRLHDVTRGIANDVESWNVASTELIRPAAFWLVHFAPEVFSEVRRLAAGARQEQRSPLQRLSCRENDPLEDAVAAFEPGNGLFAQGDTMPGEPLAVLRGQRRRPIRAHNDVPTPQE
jgi:hypothetical protein